MIWHPVILIETAETPVGQGEMDLFTEPLLLPDAKAVANLQHPKQEFWIGRWTPGVVVEICKTLTDAAKIDEPICGERQVILENTILQRKLLNSAVCASSLGPIIASSPGRSENGIRVSNSDKARVFNEKNPIKALWYFYRSAG